MALMKDLIAIPERVHQGDFVLKLAEGGGTYVCVSFVVEHLRAQAGRAGVFPGPGLHHRRYQHAGAWHRCGRPRLREPDRRSVEWDKRVVWVEPAPTEGKAVWIGSSRALGFELCQAIKRVLSDGEVNVPLSKRAAEKFASLRDAFPQGSPDSSLIEHLGAGRSRWWTFAGGRANWLLAYLIRQDGHGVRFDDFCLETKTDVTLSALADRLRSISEPAMGSAIMESRLFNIKFGEAVPESLLVSEAVARAIDRSAAERIVFASIEHTQLSVFVDDDKFSHEQ